jgi:ketosteroid isomerase-like protein
MPTTEQNLQTAGALYAAFGAGDADAFLALMADDVQWESWADNRAAAAGVPWLQPRQGKAGVLEFLAAASRMEIVELQVLDMLGNERQVAVEFVIEAKLPDCDGRSYRDEEVHLWTFDEAGKVRRLRHYTDTAKHIAAFTG